jgi:hypothetical protein
VGGRRLVFCLGVRWWALFVLPVLSFSWVCVSRWLSLESQAKGQTH